MARQTRRNQKQGWPLWLKWVVGIIIGILGIGLWAVYLTTALFLAPFLVARLVDKSENRFLARSVLAVNVCGAIPGLSALMFGKFWTFGQFIAVVGNPVYWLSAYGAAAIGWALFIYVPRFIGKYLARKAERRVAHLRRVQERLVQEWGWKVVEAAGVGSLGADDDGLDLDGAEPMGLEDQIDAAAGDYGPDDGMGDAMADEEAERHKAAVG